MILRKSSDIAVNFTRRHNTTARETTETQICTYRSEKWRATRNIDNARHTGYYWLVLCINDMWDHLCIFFCIFLMSFILYIAQTGSCITVVVWRRCNRLGQWQCDFHLRPRRRHITNRGAEPSIIMHCGLAQRRDSTDVGRTNFPVWAKLLCVLCAIFCFVYNCQFVLSTTVLWCVIGCFLVKLPS